MCVGTDANPTIIDCNQATNKCSVNGTGYPSCDADESAGDGVACEGTIHVDFFCSNNQTSGAALCISTPPSDCYSTKCVGNDTFNETYIDCDQSKSLCSVNGTGYPICDSTKSRGYGLNCTIPEGNDEFYCSSESVTGVAACVYPPKYSCYDTKCSGTNASIECNQADHRCEISEEGVPSCVNTTRGSGIDCEGTIHVDFFCSNNQTSGAALCISTPPSDCYSKKCVGIDTFNETYIDCDQSKSLCSVNGTGYPICDSTKSRGDGLNCTIPEGNDEFYCSSESVTGVAACVYPPKYSCYDTKCSGTNASIECNQADHRCEISEEGVPSCVNTTRGSGIDCEGNAHVDFFCSNNQTSGAALCISTPPSDCYSTKCVGNDTFNETYIDCDQSKSLCSVNGTGYPICDSTKSRGDGLNCTHSDSLDYFCTNNKTTGAASCSFTPPHSCYSLRCYGPASASSYIVCDGSSHRCALNSDQAPICVPGNRGIGVNCNSTVPFYCSYDSTLTQPSCTYPQNYDCFNTKCAGVGVNATYVDCPQAQGYCSFNATSGQPVCVSSNSTGAGTFCDGKYTCLDDLTTGVASCHKTRSLLPLWVVLGVVVAIILVVCVVWVVKKRGLREDTQPLL